MAIQDFEIDGPCPNPTIWGCDTTERFTEDKDLITHLRSHGPMGESQKPRLCPFKARNECDDDTIWVYKESLKTHLIRHHKLANKDAIERLNEGFTKKDPNGENRYTKLWRTLSRRAQGESDDGWNRFSDNDDEEGDAAGGEEWMVHLIVYFQNSGVLLVGLSYCVYTIRFGVDVSWK